MENNQSCKVTGGFASLCLNCSQVRSRTVGLCWWAVPAFTWAAHSEAFTPTQSKRKANEVFCLETKKNINLIKTQGGTESGVNTLGHEITWERMPALRCKEKQWVRFAEASCFLEGVCLQMFPTSSPHYLLIIFWLQAGEERRFTSGRLASLLQGLHIPLRSSFFVFFILSTKIVSVSTSLQ